MADETAKLKLPLIAAGQAQKHVTHNEALAALDAIVQLSIDGEGTAPPAAPAEGGRYLVTAPATGAWAGHAGQIALQETGSWQFLVPRTGWLAWFAATATLKAFDGIAWHAVSADIDKIDMLGINATADSVNRLSVSSEASLFNHAGHGHQLKINKQAAADTGSLLFQTNWTGQAEMGLAGDNEFSIKVSDGATWRTAIKVAQNGIVRMPQRPAARAFSAYATYEPAANSESGFAALTPVQGGITLGSALPTGGYRVRIPVAGLYLLSLMVMAGTSQSHTICLRRNTSPLFWLYAPAAAPLSLSHTHLAALEAGDELAMLHTGVATLYNANGLTELVVVMI